MRDKFIKALRRLALDGALTPSAAEALLNARDGGPGSGNHGHSGRPGKVGGSAPSVSGGVVAGNLGKNSSGYQYVGREYSLKTKGLRSITRKKGKDGRMKWSGPGKTWVSKGEVSQKFPKGTGSTRISEQDIAIGLHSINKYLNPDGTLTPERAALHERIVQNKFKNAKPVPEGQQPVAYFLGGGSASGKSGFTDEKTRNIYGMPGDADCPVLDCDKIKDEIPEYQYDSKTKTGTGTTNRDLAASFAHEESSALVKREMETAMANRFNFTLDATGDGSAAKMIKKIDQARNAGYRVEGKYCTRDIEDAIVSSLVRALKKGRNVQIDSIVDIHKAVSDVVPQIASHFDHFELWDNESKPPKLIASCERGGEIDKKDKAAWDAFVKKSNYVRDTSKDAGFIKEATRIAKELGYI